MINLIKKYFNKRKAERVSKEICACYKYASIVIDRIYIAKRKLYQDAQYHINVLRTYENSFYKNKFLLQQEIVSSQREYTFQMDVVKCLQETLSHTEQRIELLNAEREKLVSC